MDLKHYSVSTCSIECPRKLKLKADEAPQEGLPAEITEEGKSLHELARDALLTGKFTELEEQLPHGISILKDLRKHEIEPEKWVRQTLKVDESNKVMVGKVDIPDYTDRYIIDIKSRWQMKATAQDQKQLRWYAWFYLYEGWKKVRTGIYWIRYDRLEELETFDEFDKSTIEEEISGKIRKADKIISSKKCNPKPTAADCAWCDWSISCPEVEFMDKMTNEKIIAELVKRHTAYRNLDKIAQMRLNRSENAQIDIGGDKFVGWYSPESKFVDTGDFMQLAHDTKLPIEKQVELLSVNMKKFNKFIKDAPAFADVVQVGIKSRWTGAKGKGR